MKHVASQVSSSKHRIFSNPAVRGLLYEANYLSRCVNFNIVAISKSCNEAKQLRFDTIHPAIEQSNYYDQLFLKAFYPNKIHILNPYHGAIDAACLADE